MSDVIVYSKDGCPYCVKVKEVLSNLNIDYTEIDLSDNDKRQKFYDSFEHENITTVPQVFLRDKRIGGYTEMIQNIDKIIADVSISFEQDF